VVESYLDYSVTD